jgi:hypothetical protein
VTAAWLEQLGGAEDEQCRSDVAELERADAEHETSEPASEDRPHPNAQGRAFALLRSRDVADGVDDRRDGEKAGDDGEEDGCADAHRSDQGEREQRAADRAEVVHRALEPVRAPVRTWRHDVGQQRVADRNSKPPRRPRPGTQHPDLPRRSGDTNKARQHGRGGVAADRGRAPAVRVVGERAAREPRGAREAVGDALDGAERSGGRAERAP